MTRKAKKPQERTLRDKLSENFLRAFENDFAANGVAAIEQLRQKSPEKYSDIAARLIAASEPPAENGFASANSMEEIGRRLLKSVGAEEDQITTDMVEAAIRVNDDFVSKLEKIANVASTDES